MASRLFKKRAPAAEDMNLQITAMADIFTVLLVFLLKSFATGVVNVTPTPGTTLPQAVASEASIEALKVEISSNAVLIEGNPVSSLQNFKFDAKDLQANGSSDTVSRALERERQRQLLIAKSNSDVRVDPRIIVIADQRAPYATIKNVLASAALQGYTDFKLAVIKGD